MRGEEQGREGGQDRMVVAWTGASGAAYGIRLVDCLLAAGVRVELIVSKAAQVVLAQEADLALPAQPEAMRRAVLDHLGREEADLRVYGREQWTAPVASGSNPARAMVVCPCTSGTVSAIASGTSDNLIERAADVMIKEQRPLILVHRETPLSVIHLENLTRLARLGVTIMPASPGFYHRPADVSGVVDFLVARILDHLGLAQELVPRWAGETQAGTDSEEPSEAH